MKLNSLVESQALKKVNQVKLEKKNPAAWKNLEALGKKISRKWKFPQASWQLTSEGRI